MKAIQFQSSSRVSILLLMFCSSVLAQGAPRISQSLASKTGTFEPAERQEISTFLQYYAERLLRPSDIEQLRDARQELTREVNRPGATDSYKAMYATLLVGELLPAARSEDTNDLIRTNIQIVTYHLRQPAMVDLALQGLSDETTSVQYWAAKALAYMAVGDERSEPVPIDAQAERKIIDAIAAHVESPEMDPRVSYSLFQAAGGLTSDAARTKLLELLTDSATRYTAEDAKLAMIAGEDAALRSLWRWLFRLQLREQAPQDQIEKLTVVAAKLGHIASRKLHQHRDDLSAADVQAASNLLETVQRVFNLAMEAAGNRGQGPQPIDAMLELPEPNFAAIRLKYLEWVGTENEAGALTNLANIEAAKLTAP